MISFFYKKANVFSYLTSLVLLLFIINDQSNLLVTSTVFVAEKITAYVLLALCMFAVDWMAKQQYWVTSANYHLFVFLLSIYALPDNQWDNWLLLFIFFFWIAYINIVDLSLSEEKIKSTFNASFFMCLAALYFNEGIVLFPFLWIAMIIQGTFNLQLWLVSLLPIGALKLLFIVLSQFMDGIRFLTPIHFDQYPFEWPWSLPFLTNLWWTGFLFLFFCSMFRHYVDVGSKGASYRIGIFSLFILALLSVIFALLFHGETSLGWVLFSMTLAALSGRFFEQIKKRWARELFLILLTLLVLVSKKGLFFF